MTNRADAKKIEDFVVSIIQDFDDTISLSPGEPFFDLFVRLYNSTVLISILNILTQFEQEQSLSNTELPNDTYDNLLGRSLYTRKPGTYTTLTMLCSFTNDANVFNVRNSDLFTIEGSSFNPTGPSLVNKTSYFRIEGDTVIYGLRIPLIAQVQGSGSTVTLGATIQVPYTSLTGFLGAVVESDVVLGENAESNEQALQGLIQSKNVANLINIPSIEAQFAQELPGLVRNTVVVGMTDPEMFRDAVPTQLPQRKARIFFADKQTVTLIHKDAFSNVVTKFQYAKDPSIVYYLKPPAGANTVSKLGSDNWEQHPNGSYIMEVDVQLGSVENPKGFTNDVPFFMVQSLYNTINGSYITDTPYSLINPNYLGAIADTKPYSIPVFDTEGNVLNYVMESLVHVGGFSDIYVQTSVSRVSRKFKVPLDTNGIIPIPEEYKPILKIHSALDNANNVIDFIGLNTTDSTLRYSAADPTEILVDPALSNTEILLDFSYAPDLQTISTFVLDTKRIPQDNSMVRLKTPIFVNLVAEVLVTANRPEVVSALQSAFFNYINSITVAGPLPVSKVLSYLDQAVPEVAGFSSFTLTAVQMMPDGNVVDIISEDIITPVTQLALGVSDRTTQYIAESAVFLT